MSMFLRFYLNEAEERVYTMAKVDPSGKPTFSAHPARFTPTDTNSRYRILIKKRFGLLPIQQPPIKL